MLKVLEDKSTPTCLVAELDGKITVDEFRAYAAALDAAIEAGGGKASAVCPISSSPSEDWGSFKEDLKLARRDASKLTRVAYVGGVGCGGIRMAVAGRRREGVCFWRARRRDRLGARPGVDGSPAVRTSVRVGDLATPAAPSLGTETC